MWEAEFSDNMTASLNLFRDIRDLGQEWIFKAIYHNPWVTFWWGGEEPHHAGEDESQKKAALARRREMAFARRHAERGGFAEAIVRIIIAVVGAEHALDKRQYQAAENVIRRYKHYYESPAEVKKILHTQARVYEANPEKSLEGLAEMLPTQVEREEAFDVAVRIAIADSLVGQKERKVLQRIRTILELHHDDLRQQARA
jgi:tellurite resistance protein